MIATPRSTTDPTGRSFLSYRHTRSAEARLLVMTQREMGIPTWQDVDDLDEEPMEPRIRQVLSDPQTANAILWLTREVGDSDVIRRVEVPAIVARQREGDDFFVVPVAAGGLGWREAASLVEDQLGAKDLARWKILELPEVDLTVEGAVQVAERVLQRRLRAVHQTLAPEEPMRLRIFNRSEPGFEPGWALTLDWHRRFRDRFAEKEAWRQVLLPRVAAIRRALAKSAPGRRLAWTGYCTNSAALALGLAFLSRGPLRCSWLQQAPSGVQQEWHLGAQPEPVELEASTIAGDVGAEDLAVLISFADDVEKVFGASKSDLPAFRAVLRVQGPLGPDGNFQPLWLATPEQAVGVLAVLVQAVRELRRQYPVSGIIHLFAAIPVGLAFLLGQSLNTLGPVQTYEVDETGAVGRYRPEVRLRQGDIT